MKVIPGHPSFSIATEAKFAIVLKYIITYYSTDMFIPLSWLSSLTTEL